jgi:hypothetical protein
MNYTTKARFSKVEERNVYDVLLDGRYVTGGFDDPRSAEIIAETLQDVHQARAQSKAHRSLAVRALDSLANVLDAASNSAAVSGMLPMLLALASIALVLWFTAKGGGQWEGYWNGSYWLPQPLASQR